MNCQEATGLLVGYLDGEVTPLQADRIRAHLAGCDACREDMAGLSGLQGRVRRFLHVRAAQAAPPTGAWRRLQERLAREARRSSMRLPVGPGRLLLGNGLIHRIGNVMARMGLAAVAALIIGLATVAFVPSVRAQVEDLFQSWFHFRLPDGEYGMVVEEAVDFLPLFPTYLPAGLMPLEGDSAPLMIDLGEIEVRPGDVMWLYYDEQQFVAIVQGKASPNRALPDGQEMTINGQPAVLVSGLAGTFRQAFRDARLLTWNIDDTWLQLLSNLPVEEMVRIAEGLVAPAAAGVGEPPFMLTPTPPVSP